MKQKKGRCNINTTMKHEKLLVNDKSTASCQTYMSPKHYIKRYKQQQLTYKTSLQRPQFQSYQFVNPCLLLYFCVIFIFFFVFFFMFLAVV